MGKVKLAERIYDNANQPYQSPMEKVKLNIHCGLMIISYEYQFPMGKVKLTMQMTAENTMFGINLPRKR